MRHVKPNDKSMELKFISIDDPMYLKERGLRVKILREPLGLPRGSEVFEFEKEAMHLVAVEGGEVVGCVMFNPEGKSGRILQMAVAKERQGNGVGTNLVRALEARLSEDGFESVYLHAREEAVPFYERLGYSVDGAPFIEVGIRHRIMTKNLHSA